MCTPKKPDQEFVADKSRKFTINRRAFLRGAGAVAVGCPSSRGCPSDRPGRPDDAPVFTMLHRGSCGVVGQQVLPERDRCDHDVGPPAHGQGVERAVAPTPPTCCS